MSRLARLADFAYRRRRLVLGELGRRAARHRRARRRTARRLVGRLRHAGLRVQGGGRPARRALPGAAARLDRRRVGGARRSARAGCQARGWTRSSATPRRSKASASRCRRHAPRYSGDGTIAVARLPLTVSPGAVPLETGNRLIDMAEQRSGDGVAGRARRPGDRQRPARRGLLRERSASRSRRWCC